MNEYGESDLVDRLEAAEEAELNPLSMTALSVIRSPIWRVSTISPSRTQAPPFPSMLTGPTRQSRSRRGRGLISTPIVPIATIRSGQPIRPGST